MLKFQVENLDLAVLRQRFEEAGYFIPKSEKFFSLRIPTILNCGLKQYETRNHSKIEATN